MKTANQTVGQSPIGPRPARLHPPEARSMATIPAQMASGRRCQTAASSTTSGGITSASMRLPSRLAWSAVDPGAPRQGRHCFAPPPSSPRGHQASRPSMMDRMRRRSSAVSEPQTSITWARSAGSAPESAPSGSGITVFPEEEQERSIPLPSTHTAAGRKQWAGIGRTSRTTGRNCIRLRTSASRSTPGATSITSSPAAVSASTARSVT